MTAGSVLSVQNLSVSYGETRVLNDVGLEIPEGKTFGLLGLNGAGKTTLIKTLLGLRSAQEGQIEIFGRPPGDMAVRFKTAYLPERFNPSWFLTGFEFLRFSSRLYKHEFNRDEAINMAERLALATDAMERRVNTYSKGMRQKLGLIATLLTPCGFLVLDEPMSGLDPYARALMKKELIRARQEGRTVLLCTHLLSDIQQLCDMIGVMQQGSLIFTGKPEELLKASGCSDMESAFLDMVLDAKAA